MANGIDLRAYELFGPDFSACVQRTLCRLRRQFPGAFDTVKPLALGIHQALVAQTNFTEAELGNFLTFYTRSAAYLQAQTQPGAMRVDLDGNVIEPVSEYNRLYAVHQLHEELVRRREYARWLTFRAAFFQHALSPEDDDR